MNSIARALERIQEQAKHLTPDEQRTLVEQLEEKAEVITDMADETERDSYFVDDPDE